MLRIGIGGIFHETNTYAAQTHMDAFQILRAEEIQLFSRGARTYLGGLIDEATACGFDTVPLIYAEATPSGIISHKTYLTLREELVERVASADLDGLLLSLHGAGVADGVDSIEEDICRAIRTRMGTGFPVVATLDLHGNIRQELGDLCQGLFPVRFNPHIDQHERGVEAAKCLSQILLSKAKFETAVIPLPMVFPPIPTSLPVFKELDAICQELEKNLSIGCARIMHGFPYADVPQLGASVVVVARVGEADAKALAREIAEKLWSSRHDIKVVAYDVSTAIKKAAGTGSGQIVINEFSDNTGAGSPGDGTHLLAALIASGERACFSHIYDPQTAQQAAVAGVGARLKVALGGRTNPTLGQPIEAEAMVLAVGNGFYRVKSPMGTGESIDLGLLATLRIGSVDIIVSSGRRQTLDDGPFIKGGIDIADFKIVALKSSQHFRAWYEPRVAQIVTADPPGLSPVDVGHFKRKRVTRRLWPLDADAHFNTETRLGNI